MITVYTKPGCSTCQATKLWLAANKIDYLQIDVATDAAGREFVNRLGYTSLPVVVTESGHWCGFRIDKLASLRARHPGNDNAVIGP